LRHLRLDFASASTYVYKVFEVWTTTFKPDPTSVRPDLDLGIGGSPFLEDTGETRLDYTTASLSLGAPFYDLDSFVPFLPRHSACLGVLDIHFGANSVRGGPPPTSAFASVLKVNNLQTLRIWTSAAYECHDAKSYSGCQWEPVILPVSFFSTLPHIRTLELECFAGMSIGGLSLLSSSSPLLRRVNFGHSIWAVDPQTFDFLPAGPSPGEQQLIDILSRMSKLVNVNLGILPYDRERHLEALEAFCEERNIKLTVRGYEEEPELDEE
jgi:hypothetical protein